MAGAGKAVLVLIDVVFEVVLAVFFREFEVDVVALIVVDAPKVRLTLHTDILHYYHQSIYYFNVNLPR